MDALRSARPTLNIRAEVGMPDRLTRFLIEGVVQAALVYTPQMRPGLSVEKVLEDELVMVAAWPDPTNIPPKRYVFVDWGAEFVQAHASHLPDLTNTGLTMSLGALAGEFIQRRGMAGYLPARWAKPMLDTGELHLVPGAPIFPYPVWAVWRDDLARDLTQTVQDTVHQIAGDADVMQSDVMHRLQKISGTGVEVLGEDTAPAPKSNQS